MASPAGPHQIVGRTTFALFAYGLLLPGEPMWPEIERFVVARSDASVLGELYSHANGRYPMLVAGSDAGDSRARVRGVLLELRPTPAVSDLLFSGEVLVAYDARWLMAEPGSRAALAFCWPWGEVERGPRIASGSWPAR